MFSCVYLRGHVSRGDLGAEILCPVVDWMYVRSWRTTALYLRFERLGACCVYYQNIVDFLCGVLEACLCIYLLLWKLSESFCKIVNFLLCLFDV